MGSWASLVLLLVSWSWKQAAFSFLDPRDGPQAAEEQGSTSDNSVHRAQADWTLLCPCHRQPPGGRSDSAAAPSYQVTFHQRCISGTLLDLCHCSLQPSAHGSYKLMIIKISFSIICRSYILKHVIDFTVTVSAYICRQQPDTRRLHWTDLQRVVLRHQLFDGEELRALVFKRSSVWCERMKSAWSHIAWNTCTSWIQGLYTRLLF